MKTKQDLLYEFMGQKKKAYVEPVYMGRDPEGLSEKKYSVSLFTALSNWDLKKIAIKARLSHGLVRKWRTEEAFKKAERQHIQEFLDLFEKNVMKAVELWAKDFEKGDEVFGDILLDYSEYGQDLRKEILQRMKKVSKEFPELLKFTLDLSMQNLVSGIKNDRKAKAVAEVLNRELKNQQLKKMQMQIEKIAQHLEQPEISSDEKAVMIRVLKYLSVELGDFIEPEK